jgi:tRNA U34 2-thiouridine synthase MnmA/TrmU
MLNDFVQYLNNAPHCSKTRGIQIAKELLGENLPYVVERRLNGDVVVFNEHFVDTAIEAMSTDCIAKMNACEQNVMFDYMEYLNSKLNGYQYEHPYGTKKEVVEKARSLGFSFESESQDVCFIEGHYVGFLERFIESQPGLFVFPDGTPVGKHKGYYRYTVGQRRGLGISYDKPLYVVSIDAERNRVVVGEKKEIQKDAICVRNVNWHLDYENVKKFDTIQVQIRFRSRPVEVEKINYLKNEIYCVKLAAKVEAPAPGQVCAFYSNELLLGGGEITTEGEVEWKEVL